MFTIIIICIGRSDYKFGLRYVTFLAGITVVEFNVDITDDDVFEGNETFNLHIIPSLLPNRVICGNPCSTTVTIVDDETRKYN